MSNQESIFSEKHRKRRLESPDRIQDYVRVTSVSTLAIALTCLILLAALTIWAFLGNVTDKANYYGVVFPTAGTHDVTLPNAGVIREMMVHNGESVKRGQNIALVDLDGNYSVLSCDADGTVMNTKVDGEGFMAMEPIISLVNQGDVMCYAYASNEQQRDLRPGMKAQIWPADEDRDDIGYFTGTILSVGRYPITRVEVQQRFRNADLVNNVMPENGAVYQVSISLDKDSQGELCWSFGKPDDVDVSVGTYCQVMTETKKRSIVQYMFEKIRTGEHRVEQWLK